jgi:hypothetical protein
MIIELLLEKNYKKLDMVMILLMNGLKIEICFI